MGVEVSAMTRIAQLKELGAKFGFEQPISQQHMRRASAALSQVGHWISLHLHVTCITTPTSYVYYYTYALRVLIHIHVTSTLFAESEKGTEVAAACAVGVMYVDYINWRHSKNSSR